VEKGATYRIRVSGVAYGRDFLLSWRLVTGPATPINDDFADAYVISGMQGSVAGNDVGASAEDGEPQAPEGSEQYGANSIWYRWKAPEDGALSFSLLESVFWPQFALFRGSSLADLEPVTGLPRGATTSGSYFPAEAGTTYWVFLASRFEPGPFTLSWNLENGPGPANDDFADATALSGARGSITATTVSATKQKDSTYPSYDESALLHGGNDGARSVWFTWTAPAAGAVVFDTAGSNVDTLLSVYTDQPGDTIGTIYKISANDNVRADLTSRVGFIAWEGATYRIAVDSYAQRSGNFALSWGNSVPAAVDPPDTLITAKPPRWDSTGVSQFHMSSSELDSLIECWWDDEPPADCGTSAQVTGLTEGTHTFTARAMDRAGNIDPTPATWTWTLDQTAPVVATPTETFRVGTRVDEGGSVPLEIAWSASDSGSGIAAYSLRQWSSGIWNWEEVGLPTPKTTTKVRQLAPAQTYQFQANAFDKAGNGWGATGPQFPLVVQQETALTYSGSWTRQHLGSAYGGYLKYTSAQGSRATCSFTGRDGALVAPRGPNRGKAGIYVDGALVKNIDLYASSSKPRTIVFSRSWGDSGPHTISLKALGAKNSASTGKRVDADACVFLG
jgi:hypothetical protein